MNAALEPKQPFIIEKWTWGLNEEHSQKAVELATNSFQLIRMADEIISGRLNIKEYKNSYEILNGLITNPRLPLEKARLLQKCSDNEWCLFDLCSRADATAELLDECADDATQYAVNAIVFHENVKPETVAKFTKCSDLQAVEVALSSGRLPVEFLESFATSEVPVIRTAVAISSKNPQTLAKLAFDPEFYVRWTAATRDIIEISVLEKMALTDTDLRVAAEATKRITDPEILAKVFERVSGEYGEYLAAAIAQNEHAPDAIRVAAELGSN